MNPNGSEHRAIHHRNTGEFTLNYQQFIEKMMAAIPDSVYVYDLINQRNVYANREVSQILGYTPEDFVAMGSALVMELFHPEDYPRQVKGLQRFEQARDGEVILSEYRMRHKDGSYRWISMRDVIFQRTPEGKPHLILGVARDVTEQRLMEQQAVALAMATERNHLLARVMSSISHDIRTPLSIISTSVYLMSKTTDPEKLRERQQVIEAQIRRISDLTDQFHELVRVQRLIGIQAAPVDLNKVIREVCDAAAQQARDKKISVSPALAASLPQIQGDEFYVFTALRQLVDNALRFTPEQGEVWVETRYDPDTSPPRVRLLVRDTGSGIQAEDLPHIFEPFYKADKARTFDTSGAGLGLSVVKRIVELHNGEIHIESEFGRGTAIILSFNALSSSAFK